MNRSTFLRGQCQMSTTRMDLAKAAAKASGIPISDCMVALDTMFIAITASVCAGRQVHLRRFGVFYSKRRRPRPARNVSAGTVVQVPAHTVMLARITCLDR